MWSFTNKTRSQDKCCIFYSEIRLQPYLQPDEKQVQFYFRGNNVDLVLCVLLGHQNSKIANSMKLVNFALFSSQYHVFELKNIRGNLIAPNSNRWSLSNKIAMSQEDNRKIISLFGQEKSIFLHP